MRFDEGSDGDFFYGPSVMIPYREPFANERYLLGDGRPQLWAVLGFGEKVFWRE
jgi:hypothetical protein